MPYRPKQHQIASQAVAAVSTVWADTGAAVEEIKQDYGEDLLVQPCFEDVMDTVRIWVQVKGTQRISNYDKAIGKTTVRIRADLALRWARSADTLVLILWDVNNHVGWYSIPSPSDLGHEELARKGREYITLQIDFKNEFNNTSANLIIWDARINHLADFVRNYRRLGEEDGQFSLETKIWANEAIAAAVIDMMMNLQMIDNKDRKREILTINPNFIKLIFKTTEERDVKSNDDVHEILGPAVMASLLKQSQKITGNGLPTALITEMCLIAMAIIDPEFFK